MFVVFYITKGIPIKRTVLVSLLAICTLSANASPLSSRIELGSYTIAPTQTAAVSLTALVKGLTDSVNCEIDNPSKGPVVISVKKNSSYSISPWAYHNGNVITAGQSAVKPGKNTLNIKYVSVFNSGNDKLTEADITNADLNTSVSLNNCYASAQTS